MRPVSFGVGRLRAVAAAVALLAFGCTATSAAVAQTAPSAPAAAPAPAAPASAASESGANADTLDAPGAVAQASPGASPTPVPITGETPAPIAAPKKPARPAARKFEHFEATPTLQYTISSGSDVIPQNGTKPNALPFDLLRIIGDARYRFNSHLGLLYQRISHTGAAGRTYRNGKPNYGGSGYDYEERELATWNFNPLLVYRAGYHYRARVCCPGAGDPTGIPRFLGGFFNDLSWRFGPNTIGGKPITTSFRWEQNYHRFTAAAQKNIPRGDYDSGQKPTFAYTLYSNLYVYHQTKLVPYYGIEYFSTYFSNNPHMSVTYRKVYGMQYRATNDLGWRFYVKNDQPNGLAAGPDASHKSTAFLEASYRIHR